MYHNYHYSYNNTISPFSNNSVPTEIVQLFNETFPGVEATTYAFIEEKYKTLIPSAYIICGYWIFDYKYSDDNDILELDCEKLQEDLFIYTPAHTMKNTPGEYFIGKIIEELPYTTNPKTCHQLNEKMHKVYTQVELPSKEKILKLLHTVDNNITLSELPMLILLQCNCYCCT